MKKILPVLGMMLLLGACDNTKMQLRAPQAENTEIKAVKAIDSVVTDTTKTVLKN